MTRSTVESIQAIKTIQENNGEFGANRYIISNNESALNVMETFALFKLCDWENATVDIIPLFVFFGRIKINFCYTNVSI